MLQFINDKVYTVYISFIQLLYISFLSYAGSIELASFDGVPVAEHVKSHV